MALAIVFAPVLAAAQPSSPGRSANSEAQRQAAPPSQPQLAHSALRRVGIESADGRNSVYLTGQLHLDVASYLDYEPQSEFAAVQSLDSGINARRARIGVRGKLAGDWRYALVLDFGGATGLSGRSDLNKAFVTYNGLNRGQVPLAFDLGFMKTPFTLDEATSSNDILFVERASIATVAAGVMAGGRRSAFGMRSNDRRRWAGVYLTGPVAGASAQSGWPLGAFGRATYQMAQRPDCSLHLGVDLGGLLIPPGSAGVRSITLADRPELRVDPTRILGTGALGTAAHPVDDAAVFGVEAAAGYRSAFVQAEYYHILVDRNGLKTNGFDGGYIEASWTLTGEHRRYKPGKGAYAAITPAHPFSPWQGRYGPGAFELAGRFSTISLDDDFLPGRAGPANAVGGGRQTVYALGLNWYANANMRFTLDYLHGVIDKRYSAAAGGGIAGTPLGAPVGGCFDAIVLRLQVAY